MSNPDHRPRMIVVAGPPGAGKTMVRQRFLRGLPVVDAEDLLHLPHPADGGDTAAHAAALDAAINAEIGRHMFHRRTFIWETYLLRDWSEGVPVPNFSESDYDLELFFVGASASKEILARWSDETEDAAIDQLESKLQATFDEYFGNLAAAITHAKSGALYDNTHLRLTTVASISKDGIIVPPGDRPPWYNKTGLTAADIKKTKTRAEFEKMAGNRLVNPGAEFTRDPDPDLHHGVPEFSTFEPGRTPPQSVRHPPRRSISM